MSYLEEVLPEFRNGAKIRRKDWYEKHFVSLQNDSVRDQDGYLYNFDYNDCLNDVWEIYQEPINWDYIVKNKCLCWFWDGNNYEKKKLDVYGQ